MRIAYFTESLLPLVDGVSLTLKRLFDRLEERGVEFRVYSPFVPELDAVPWAHRVVRVPHAPLVVNPGYRVALPVMRRIRRDLDAFRPDLVHLVSPSPLAYRARAEARRRGLPVVASFHTHFVSYFRFYRVAPLERLGWGLLRNFYGGSDRTFAPSRAIGAELEAHGIHNVTLWSRGVDTALFSPARRDGDLRRRTSPEGAPTVLFVSRLVKEKNLADLVAAEGILRDRGVPHRLVLVGDGPMRGELEKGLPEAHFAGHQEGAALARWYASADLFVFPSTTETFGNVVLEALASGLPAVVADRGGQLDLVEDGANGLVTRSDDPDHLAEQITRLLGDGELRGRMAEGARRSAEGRSWQAINDGLVAEYEALIAAGSREGAPA
jgi:phosphatidylinositol alpha 1,6-mannosyltransferase